MTEWSVVGVIIALVGLFLTVGRPVTSLIQAIERLTTICNQLSAKLNKLESDNKDSHRRLWEHNDEQDERINEHKMKITDHENRIKRLEGDKDD